MSTDKSKSNVSSNVSLFPMPPWQLINKFFGVSSNTETPPRPPTPPHFSAYRMFGNFYNADDSILRSLEAQGVRRVYSQTSNRKRELRKINFSILANYLDLLDIITRDPSSPKRTEKLDYLAILFINMHHLINEYRQHQARDSLREILKYQVNVGSETVEKAEQYLTRTEELLRAASNDLVMAGSSTNFSGNPNLTDGVQSGLHEFGHDLVDLLQMIFNEKVHSNIIEESVQELSNGSDMNSKQSNSTLDDLKDAQISDHIDMALWQFFLQSRDEFEDCEI